MQPRTLRIGITSESDAFFGALQGHTFRDFVIEEVTIPGIRIEHIRRTLRVEQCHFLLMERQSFLGKTTTTTLARVTPRVSREGHIKGVLVGRAGGHMLRDRTFSWSESCSPPPPALILKAVEQLLRAMEPEEQETWLRTLEPQPR